MSSLPQIAPSLSIPALPLSPQSNGVFLLSEPFSVLDSSRASLFAPITSLPEWFYMDPQGKIQGPFSQDNMRLWHEGGYFPSDLPIKLRSWTAFHAFAEVFVELRSAFFAVPVEPSPKQSLLGLPVALGLGGILSVPQPAPPARGTAAQLHSSYTQPPSAVFQAPAEPVAAAAVPSPVSIEATVKEELTKPAELATSAAAVPAPSDDFPIAHSVAKSDFAKQLLGIAPKPSIAQAAPTAAAAPSKGSESGNSKGAKQAPAVGPASVPSTDAKHVKPAEAASLAPALASSKAESAEARSAKVIVCLLSTSSTAHDDGGM
jgi:hypothetical protein